MLTDQEAKELGKSISSLVQERGLGALSKKDYELLVFHHISTATAHKSDWNYVLANKLKVRNRRQRRSGVECLLWVGLRHSRACKRI